MANIIRIKIDVSKIEKDRLFQGKNGAKYLDAACIPTRNSQYGDTHVIVQDVSKEERLAGKKGPIIGNAKEQAARDTAAREPRTEVRTIMKADEPSDVDF